MKKPGVILIGLAGLLLVAGAVVLWPGRAVTSVASQQTMRYDPVKNATFITKDGFTWCVAGNLTNGTVFKTNAP